LVLKLDAEADGACSGRYCFGSMYSVQTIASFLKLNISLPFPADPLSSPGCRPGEKAGKIASYLFSNRPTSINRSQPPPRLHANVWSLLLPCRETLMLCMQSPRPLFPWQGYPRDGYVQCAPPCRRPLATRVRRHTNVDREAFLWIALVICLRKTLSKDHEMLMVEHRLLSPCYRICDSSASKIPAAQPA